MPDTTANFRVGSALLTYGGVTLGEKGEGTELTFEPELVPMTGDSSGSTLRDEAVMGYSVTVTTELKQLSINDMDAIWSKLYSENESQDATHIHIQDQTNDLLGANSAALVVKRRKNAGDGTLATAEQFVIWKAVMKPNGPITFTNEEQASMPVMFTGYLDEETGRIMTMGKSAA